MKRKARKNPSTEAAEQKFAEFHDFEPNNLSQFASQLKIPAQGTLVGPAAHVMYRSNKWGEKADYIHEHAKGVKVVVAGTRNVEGKPTVIPKWIQDQKVLVKLGTCLGYAWWDAQGLCEMPQGGELFCTPCGKCLFVIQKRSKLEAIVWGGKLGVEPRGIVN